MSNAHRIGLRSMIISAVALAGFTGTVRAQDVQSDWDRSYDFSKLHRYNFAVQNRLADDPLAVNPLNEKRVRVALDSQLTARGFVRDTTGQADFLVAYAAAMRQGVNIDDYGPLWRSQRFQVNMVTEGTLVVDLRDAGSKELVWRGLATGEIRPEEAEKKIPRAVDKLIDKLVKDIRRR